MNQNFKFGNLTDTGLVRQANEDYYGCFDTPNGFVFALCDGMGGHIGGAVASQTAVESIKDYYNASSYDNAIISLQNALSNANNAIIEKINETPNLQGMGTTAVLLLIKNDSVYYAHIGDSRIYYYHENELFQITSDHSFVQDLVSRGLIKPEEAERHPRKNEITKALGINSQIDPTICNTPITAVEKDCFLLCSDGLTGMVSDSFIREVLSNLDYGLQEKVAVLINEAKTNGGLDNITIQLIQFGKTIHTKSNFKPVTSSAVIDTRKNSPAKSKKKLIYLLSVIMILTIAYLFYNFLGSRSQIKKEEKKQNTNLKKDSGQSINTGLKDDVGKEAYNQYDLPVNKNETLNKDQANKKEELTKGKNKRLSLDEPIEIFEYKIQPGDKPSIMEKKFHKSWSELNKDDKKYNDNDPPLQGKTISIPVRAIGHYKDASDLEISKKEVLERCRCGMTIRSLIVLENPNVILVPLKEFP